MRQCIKPECQSKSANRLLNAVDNILHILIAHLRACGEAHSDFEQGLRNSIHVCRSTGVHRLLVHRLPQPNGVLQHFHSQKKESVKETICATFAIGHPSRFRRRANVRSPSPRSYRPIVYLNPRVQPMESL